MAEDAHSAADAGLAGALAQAARARLTLVVGDSDTGKTTLTTRLANALHAGESSVAVIDGDTGQSQIGPPTTVGLGRVSRPLGRLGDAELIAMRFVGSTSPVKAFAATVEAMGAMADRARAAGFARILVDSCGLVSGAIGQALVRATINRLEPEVLVVLERAGECAPIVVAARARSGLAVVSLPALPGVRSRTAAERRQWREAALATHFAGARPVLLDLARVTLTVPGRDPDATDLAPPADEAVAGRLAGLDGRDGDTLGLGIVVELDRAGATLVVETRVAPAAVASVTLGRETYR